MEEKLFEAGQVLSLLVLIDRTIALRQKSREVKMSLLKAAKDITPSGDAVLPVDGFLHPVIDSLCNQFAHLAVPPGVVDGGPRALNHQHFVRSRARCLIR